MINSNPQVQRFSPTILKEYIESINIYKFEQDSNVELIPKGVFEVIFQNSKNFKHNTSYSNGWQIRPKSFIGGLHNKAYKIESLGINNFCISVEFKKNAAKYFIKESLPNFFNNLVEISEVWGDSSINLSQKILEEDNIINKINHIEEFFSKQFIKQDCTLIDSIINKISSNNGFIKVTELSQQVGLSESHFRKKFRDEVGVSPSQYCKIIRINSSMKLINNLPNKSLTELTYLLGYFDQSHFIKDFRSLCGSSPKFFRNDKVIY